MEELKVYINETLENIKSKISEEHHYKLNFIEDKLYEIMNLVEEIDSDIYDQQEENKCLYVLKRGKNKGQKCGKICRSNFCVNHSKRMFKE